MHVSGYCPAVRFGAITRVEDISTVKEKTRVRVDAPQPAMRDGRATTLEPNTEYVVEDKMGIGSEEVLWLSPLLSPDNKKLPWWIRILPWFSPDSNDPNRAYKVTVPSQSIHNLGAVVFENLSIVPPKETPSYSSVRTFHSRNGDTLALCLWSPTPPIEREEGFLDTRRISYPLAGHLRWKDAKGPIIDPWAARIFEGSGTWYRLEFNPDDNAQQLLFRDFPWKQQTNGQETWVTPLLPALDTQNGQDGLEEFIRTLQQYGWSEETTTPAKVQKSVSVS